MKLLTCSPLPPEESTFFELLHAYFPGIYDIKYLMLSFDSLKGGLNKLAEDLKVRLMSLVHVCMYYAHFPFFCMSYCRWTVWDLCIKPVVTVC